MQKIVLITLCNILMSPSGALAASPAGPSAVVSLVPLLLVLAPLLFVMFRKPKTASLQPRFALSNCSFLRMLFAFPYGLGFLYFLMALISIAQDRYARIREEDLLFFVTMTVLSFFAFLYTLFGGSLRKGTTSSSVAPLQSGTEPTPQIGRTKKGTSPINGTVA